MALILSDMTVISKSDVSINGWIHVSSLVGEIVDPYPFVDDKSTQNNGVI